MEEELEKCRGGISTLSHTAYLTEISSDNERLRIKLEMVTLTLIAKDAHGVEHSRTSLQTLSRSIGAIKRGPADSMARSSSVIVLMAGAAVESKLVAL